MLRCSKKGESSTKIYISERSNQHHFSFNRVLSVIINNVMLRYYVDQAILVSIPCYKQTQLFKYNTTDAAWRARHNCSSLGTYSQAQACPRSSHAHTQVLRCQQRARMFLFLTLYIQKRQVCLPSSHTAAGIQETEEIDTTSNIPISQAPFAKLPITINSKISSFLFFLFKLFN